MSDKANSSLTQGVSDTGDFLYGVVGGNSRKIQVGQAIDLRQALGIDDSPQFVNETLTGYLDVTEIAEPSAPAANVARIYAVDDGAGVTTASMKDSAGNVVPLSHFLQAGTGAVTRTQHAKLRDLISVKDWGAVGDGVANDTTAVTAADAATGAKFAPTGVYDTTLAASALNGPYWGRGQIRDVADHLRGPWFSAVKAAPSSLGVWDSVTTAFDGDLSKVQVAMEHRITGAATLTQPSSGYVYTPEAYARLGFLYNESGFNNSLSGNDGRTAAVFDRVTVFQNGQGDAVAFNVKAFVTGTKASSTHFLANPAVTAINGDFTAGAAGVYINPCEFVLDDGGFDAAGIGYVVNMKRTVTTGAKTACWIGFRSQSTSGDVNAHFSASGQCDVGVDLTNITTDANKAVAALRADDRIYGNASSSNSFYATALGSVYFDYSSTKTAWEFAGPVAAPINLRTAISVNFNSANTDTSLAIALPPGYTRYRISNIVISGASASISTATCGLFTAAAAGGTAIIANPTTITVTTATDGTNNNMQTIAPTNVNTQSFANATLFFRVITAQGSTATATVTININPIS